MHDDLKAQLERFLPIGVAVTLKDGKMHGIVEHSFSIGEDANRVRAFWSGKAYSMLGEHQLNGMKDAAHNGKKPGEFVFDALSDECPIEIDWESWLADMAAKPGDKYRARNAKFTVKPHGVWQLRAMQAEKELASLKPRFTSVCQARDEADEQLEKLRAILNPQETEENEDHV